MPEENRLDRIERILESQAKHYEALTQSVELLGAMQLKTEETANKNVEMMGKLVEEMGKLTASTKRLERVAMKAAADFHVRLIALEEGE